MQTFLPYPEFLASLRCLDRQRLGKQRVEAFQILRALAGITDGWKNHPATRMWRGYEAALVEYYNLSLSIWRERGYANHKLSPVIYKAAVIAPSWLGNPLFHASHRSNLLRKNYAFYSQYGWSESLDLPYVWPRERT